MTPLEKGQLDEARILVASGGAGQEESAVCGIIAEAESDVGRSKEISVGERVAYIRDALISG